ncbi:hypothetical protein BI291_17215 [Thalassotalea sp. PP2-459]|nr:hypothetical protein BI291_17215 [Thalassotalea sp. PP2-459]
MLSFYYDMILFEHLFLNILATIIDTKTKVETIKLLTLSPKNEHVITGIITKMLNASIKEPK